MDVYGIFQKISRAPGGRYLLARLCLLEPPTLCVGRGGGGEEEEDTNTSIHLHAHTSKEHRNAHTRVNEKHQLSHWDYRHKSHSFLPVPKVI